MAKPDRLSKRVVDEALDYFRRRPWGHVDPVAPILVRTADDEEPLVAMILGHDGEDPGLLVHAGPGAMESIVDGLVYQAGTDEFGSGRVLFVLSKPWGEIPDPLRRLSQDAGVQVRRDRHVPLCFRDADEPRPPSRKDLDRVSAVLQALNAADDAGALDPLQVDPVERQILQLVVTGHGKRAQVSAEVIDWPALGALPSVGEVPAWNPARSAIDVIDGVARCGWVPLEPADDDDAEAAVEWALAILDGDDPLGFLLRAHVRSTSGAELWEGLEASARRGRDAGHAPRLPRELHVNDPWLLQALAPALESAGVCVLDQERLEDRRAVQNDLERALDHVLHPTPPAEPRSVDDWRAVDRYARHLVERESASMHDDADLDGALALYFGATGFGESVLRDFSDLGSAEIFDDWLNTRYPVAGRQGTVVDTVLDDSDLPRPVAELLESWRAGHVGLYRVHHWGEDARCSLEDVVTGQRHDARVDVLAEIEESDACFPLRLYRAGEHLFADLAGPVLPPREVPRALRHLESLGMELTPAGSRDHAHLWGRLWGLLLEGLEDPEPERATDLGSPPEVEVPLDDRLPDFGDVDPDSDDTLDEEEREGVLREVLLRRYVAWLDESLPVLDGSSPREACATPEGRRRVEVLIRSMPDPRTGSGTVPAPREELLRELGLERG